MRPLLLLLAEAYDILHVVGGLSNDEIAAVFAEWNKGDLQSFLIEITAIIAAKKDDEAGGFLVDKIVDKTGSKGTGGSARCPLTVSVIVLLTTLSHTMMRQGVSWWTRPAPSTQEGGAPLGVP